MPSMRLQLLTASLATAAVLNGCNQRTVVRERTPPGQPRTEVTVTEPGTAKKQAEETNKKTEVNVAPAPEPAPVKEREVIVTQPAPVTTQREIVTVQPAPPPPAPVETISVSPAPEYV